MQQDKPILIAGGGIGGLAAALDLAKRSFRVAVLECAPVLGEIGACIQLGPTPCTPSTTSATATPLAPWRSM